MAMTDGKCPDCGGECVIAPGSGEVCEQTGYSEMRTISPAAIVERSETQKSWSAANWMPSSRSACSTSKQRWSSRSIDGTPS